MHSNNFDVLRLIAAFGVFWMHGVFFFEGKVFGFFKQTQSFGSLSVYVFFIVSGFLIFQSLSRRDDVFFFVLRRGSRIFPGLVVAAFFSVFVVGWFVTHEDKLVFVQSPQVWSVFLNYASGIAVNHKLPGVFESNPFPYAVNGSLWTIKYELMSYIVLFLLFKFKKYFSNIDVVGVAALLTGIFIFFEWGQQTNSNVIKNFPILLFCFLLGACSSQYRLHRVRPLWLAGLAILSGILAYVPQHKTHIALMVALCLMFAVLWLGFALPVLRLRHDFSYGLYIYAFPIQQAVTAWGLQHGWNLWVCLSIAFLGAMGMAVFSWFWVEKPSIAFASRWIARQDARLGLHHV